MKSFKNFYNIDEAKSPRTPPRGSAEAKHKDKLTKGLKQVSEKEYWAPENIRKMNARNQFGETYSYDQEGNPLYKGNADWSRGKWRTMYDSDTEGRSGVPVSLKVTQQDENGKTLGQEWWVPKY